MGHPEHEHCILSKFWHSTELSLRQIHPQYQKKEFTQPWTNTFGHQLQYITVLKKSSKTYGTSCEEKTKNNGVACAQLNELVLKSYAQKGCRVIEDGPLLLVPTMKTQSQFRCRVPLSNCHCTVISGYTFSDRIKLLQNLN